VDGVFLLAFPALLSAVGLFIMRRKAIFRRSVFLALLTVIVYGAFYLASFALANTWDGAKNVAYVGFASAFVLWYFTLLLAFDFRRSAFFLAIMQMVLFLIFYLARGGFAAESDLSGLVMKVYLGSFVFLAALYAFFYVISAPMKKNLGISSMDALSMFASQWLYGDKGLEEVFDEMGEEAETLVWLCEFSGKQNRALFVVPYIHYGPFGNLGGSEFTHMISEALEKHELGKGAAGKAETREVFVFHGTATHDFNPVSSSEIHRAGWHSHAAG
jgi:putative membrane protein